MSDDPYRAPVRFHHAVGDDFGRHCAGIDVGFGAGAAGAFLGGRGFGEPTALPWGVYLWDKFRHPVQLVVALLAILGILRWLRERRSFDGHSFALFVALYAGSRLFLEAFRAETPLMASGVRTVQVVALGVMVGAAGYLYRRRFLPMEEAPGGDVPDAIH